MLEDLTPTKRIQPCVVAERAKDLSDKDRELLDTYLADTDTFTDYALAKALKERGFSVEARSINRHRKKGCPCWTT